MSSHTNNRNSSSISEEALKKSKNARKKRLMPYTWGFGLEHEVQIFHKPKQQIKNNINDFVMFNSKPFIEELLKKNQLSTLDREFLETIPFEPTGRKCDGKVVLPKTPVPMPEFITGKPFSTLKNRRTIESYTQEIRENEDKFYKLLHLNDKVIKLEEKYGMLEQYPFGMTNYFKYPTNKGLTYQYEKTKEGKEKLFTDYLGSYHITITLPFSEKTPLNKFIKMHQNFANQIQWIEPLLITAFFSSDQKAVGTKEKRIKGSYRVARIGWGNLAGSDVRKFNTGIGRYSNIRTFWRDNLDFYNVKKVNYCKKISPKLKKVEPGAVAALSSNFRTFGSTDPNRPLHRESGIGMTKPNGVELRIFDHFDSHYLLELCKFVIYIAENSRVHLAKKYVYQNKDWITSLQRIMLDGWNAELPEGYINDLRSQLDLKIKTKSKIAYDVLTQLNKELYQKNKDGDWTFLLLDEITEPKLPHINRYSWETGLMLKLNNEKTLMTSFNKLIKDLPANKELTVEEFRKIFYKYFNKERWGSDVEDVMYFLETIQIVNLSFKMDGKINWLKLKKKRVIKNFNNELIQEWSRPLLEDYLFYISKIVK